MTDYREENYIRESMSIRFSGTVQENWNTIPPKNIPLISVLMMAVETAV